MTRQVRTCPGAAYDLGYHVVWCPKYRLEELYALWSRSFFVATAGAVSVDTVRRSIELQDDRVPTGGGARA
ncbi:hypothetical protein [Streptosporangium sp. OZ121]|uniref:hypothetical protein n=1 Tax=Streptosporangium sp. OZ121 TaxID=3444183 RepID=UPI003F78C2F1